MFDLIGTIKKKSGVDDFFGNGMNVPKSVQDVIKIDTVYADGMFAVDSTGYSTGSHVHYEVIQNGVRVDAMWFYNR